MAPDVVLRKLRRLRRLIGDLTRFETATVAEIEAAHYEVERIFELLSTVATDLLQHLLAERSIVPVSYRDVHRLAHREGLIADEDLARRLGDAAGMRNLLVHLYEEFDYAILHASVGRAIDDFSQLVTALSTYASD